MKTRVFEAAELQKFARLSGDFNPLHCDPVAARRLLGGRQLVHGVLATLWALNEVLPGDGPCRFRRVKASFSKPIPVGVEIECHLESSGTTHLVELSIDSSTRFKIEFDIVREPTGDSPEMFSSLSGIEVDCVDQDFDAAVKARGELPLYLDFKLLEEMFPALATRVPPHQVAALLATSRLVGMQCPGLHSVFQGLRVEFPDTLLVRDIVTYRVERIDARFSRIVLALESNWMTATLDTFYRASTAQPSYAELRSLVTVGEFSGLRALIVGGSRGIGEVAAKLLAAGGADTRISHCLGAEDAARCREEIRLGGGSCYSFRLDVASSPDSMREALVSGLGAWVPNFCVYMATPRIDMDARRAFSSALFARYSLFYVEAFERLVHWILARSNEALTIVYPSTAALDVPSNWSQEYAAAKAAGEALCNHMQAFDSRLRISRPRFPRLETDQTATPYPTQAPEIGPFVLACLRDIHGERALD